MSRFNQHYPHIISYDLIFKDHFINVMQFPKLNNIILNSGLGHKALIPSTLWTVILGLESISYRRPIITRAKKSIDQFKVRFNTPLGCKLTLRSSQSFIFFHNLVNQVLPRLEDLSFLSAYHSPCIYEKKQSDIYINDLIKESNNNCFYRRSSSIKKDIPKFFKNLRIKSSFFLAFSKYYFTLKLTSSILNFFFDHSTYYIISKRFNNQLSSRKNSNKITYYSFSFGLNDFFTSFSTDFDKFNASYGLDITFTIRFSNHYTLSNPSYFSSFFQMPL